MRYRSSSSATRVTRDELKVVLLQYTTMLSLAVSCKARTEQGILMSGGNIILRSTVAGLCSGGWRAFEPSPLLDASIDGCFVHIDASPQLVQEREL